MLGRQLGAERGQLAHQPVAAGFQDQLLLGLRGGRDPVAEIGELALEALQPLLLGVAQLGRLRGAAKRGRFEQGARLGELGEPEAARRVARQPLDGDQRTRLWCRRLQCAGRS